MQGRRGYGVRTRHAHRGDCRLRARPCPAPLNPLSEGILAGDARALARAITRVERHDPEAMGILAEVYPRSGQAWVVGVTGAPGVGKSTLVDRLAGWFLSRGHRVGVLAVDPSSPYSGGALLGDRVRLEQAVGGIFFRSLASRGAAGGLSAATRDAIDLMDAFGLDPILVETVGAGQSEVAVMAHAHTTVVVCAPGLGDDVQAEKAGILEIADVLVVNKADLPGAAALAGVLRRALSLSSVAHRPPVVEVRALEGAGVAELAAALAAERDRAPGGQAARRRRAAESAVREHLARLLLDAAVARAGSRWGEALDEVAARRQDPLSAAQSLLGIVVPAGDRDPSSA